MSRLLARRLAGFRLVATVVAPLVPLLPCAAQAPPDSARRTADSLAADSLRARLARAEAAIALLREQLAAESQSAVHTASRLRLELSAQVLTNAFVTRGRALNVDVPQSVLAPPAPGSDAATDRSFGMTLRQTRIGAALAVDDVLGATFSGDVDFDLFGGVQGGPGDRRLFPEPRLRTARAQLRWSRTELLLGSETPLISDRNPVSLAGIGIPVFSGAGNLWNWLGQIRLTQELARRGDPEHPVRWLVQGAVMSPYANTIAPGEPDAIDAGERSARPALEARTSVRWGDADAETVIGGTIADRGGEIGVGAHRGWIAVQGGRMLSSHAVSIDGRAVIARGVELRGEGYVGRLLRGLGGGAIGQNFGTPAAGSPAGTLGPAIRDIAGWLQVNVQPRAVLLGGIGCGVDLANVDDDPVRRQNTVCAIHTAWRPAQPLVIGLEYRQLATRYQRGTFGVRHVNLAFGFEL